MAIEARCPQCEAGIRAGEKYAGKYVKCPKCGATMQVPPAGESASPPAVQPAVAATSASVPAESVEPKPTPVPQAAPSPAGITDDGPVVRIEDDDERWRKSVSRKKPAARKTGSSPAWLWPAVAAGACAALAAVAFVAWPRQPEPIVADGDSPTALVQNSSDADAATASSGELSDDPSPDDNELTARNDEPTTPSAEHTAPDNTAGETLAAMTPAPSSSDAEAPSAETSESTETTTAETETKTDSSDTAAESSAVASTDKPAPVVLEGPPDEVLKEHGIRVVGEQAALIDEAAPALRAALRDAQKLRLSLTKAFAETMKLEQLQKNLNAEYGARNAALAQVNANGLTNVSANNLLVSQLEAIRSKTDQVEETLDASRAKLSQAREAYIEHLLKTRGIVEGVEKKYEEAAADPEVRAAIAQLSKDADNELTLEPLGSFHRAQKDLAELEEQILSDTIVARVQSGNLHVSTMVNGEHSIEMVVDSGASVVTLPYATAVAAGLKPKDTDPVAQFQIADGSLITGQMITIPSLRVGKFTVENVEAAVLGPEAVGATPLLGMSFLGKFETKIDSNRGHLILSRIEGTEGSAKIR
ncbi:MAG: TIGR02281 family clan AA aspartic protease [Planctomycetaceae bacterium]|nr:TIGR02281 family clan AA aspartic protease [Planctomycetaceae bacterium]